MTKVCSGCGAELDSWTFGCDQCVNRNYKRAIRSNDPIKLRQHYAKGIEHKVRHYENDRRNK